MQFKVEGDQLIMLYNNGVYIETTKSTIDPLMATFLGSYLKDAEKAINLVDVLKNTLIEEE